MKLTGADALDQGLLSPFQYFGLYDEVDLRQVDFRAGRYAPEALSALFSADDARAMTVLRAVQDRVTDPARMRAIGFCVSTRHAEFMARYFSDRGLPSAVLLGDTAAQERPEVLRRLARGELCAVFTVDVLNEGVDVPAVDTVLFLRPTESATVFIQQLGRGLRLHRDKCCLTVLDFVGHAHKAFRFDQRFRALLGGGTRKEIERQVEEGFPTLPPGCSIQLQEKAREAVLENLRQAVGGWRGLGEALEPGWDLATFLRQADLSVEELYASRRSFTALRAARGLADPPPDSAMWRALPRLTHVDSDERLVPWLTTLAARRPPGADAEDPAQRALFAALGQADRPLSELPEFLAALWADAPLRDELRQLLEVLRDQRRAEPTEVPGLPFRLHAHYHRAELTALLGLRDARGVIAKVREGVRRVDAIAADLLFVTLEKEERDFTPTTLYEDYLISPTRFHWESQFTTSAGSPTGRRYQSAPPGWRFLLFARQRKQDSRGLTSPFLFLGPLSYRSHEGERPMRITWDLAHSAPAAWFQRVKVAAG
ncbi:MAG: DUF3427 domain-containing protein [Deltaproteobacteria bacterium]|nr:DUF3427 domain-containing protein [Deltaproteobacteria bacterium]